MSLPFPFFELTPAPSANTSSASNMAMTYNEPATKSRSKVLELTPPPNTNPASTKMSFGTPSAACKKRALEFPIKFLELTPHVDAFKPLFSKYGQTSATATTSGGGAYGFSELTPPLRKGAGKVKEDIVGEGSQGELEGQDAKVNGDPIRSRTGMAGMERSRDSKGIATKMMLQKRVDSANGLRNWPC